MASTYSASYRVKEGEKVTLSIAIGYGQLGATRVLLDHEVVADKQEGDFELVLPGDGEDLRDKVLRIDTLVTDRHRATNFTAVTYGLSGGAREFEHKIETKVMAEGKSEWYLVEVNFY
ncbi:MAG: hypothetical protein KAW46_06295 [candidate division Zixibacteria bacterium]|nr:hypothetical protein [candidate division Zixibacteria bacterium]